VLVAFILKYVWCCLQRFLSQNGLCLIIRSHEGPDARHKRAQEQKMPSVGTGYSVDHETPSELLGPEQDGCSSKHMICPLD
jgi:hypothetical protein